MSRVTRCRRAFANNLGAGVVAVAVWMPAFGQLEANRRPPRPEVTLPDGPVRQIILSSCTACHGIDEYGYYAMDRESWQALITRMESTPSGIVRGAVVSNADREILLDWLVAEFGPDATPFPREYVVRELAEADKFTDVEAAAKLDEACVACHAPLDSISALGADLDESRWREVLTAKIATGVPLLIDEVDPLIEWLTRSLDTL
jgi:mono/diheme cytochrome c family protein